VHWQVTFRALATPSFVHSLRSDYPLLRSVVAKKGIHSTTIPSLKVISRLSPSQSNAATDAGSSRNTTITLCEVVKFRKRSGKSRFEEKNAGIKLQPNTVAERTQESPKEATLSTCSRGCECCVVRSLDKRVTKRHRNTSDVILMVSGGRQCALHQSYEQRDTSHSHQPPRPLFPECHQPPHSMFKSVISRPPFEP
jgi:hypothetical protein